MQSKLNVNCYEICFAVNFANGWIWIIIFCKVGRTNWNTLDIISLEMKLMNNYKRLKGRSEEKCKYVIYVVCLFSGLNCVSYSWWFRIKHCKPIYNKSAHALSATKHSHRGDVCFTHIHTYHSHSLTLHKFRKLLSASALRYISTLLQIFNCCKTKKSVYRHRINPE